MPIFKANKGISLTATLIICIILMIIINVTVITFTINESANNWMKKVSRRNVRLVDMYKQARTEGCNGICCENPMHLHTGDYLNYTPIEGTTISVSTAETGCEEVQTYTVDMDTTWRVLGLNEDETELLIISGSPIQKEGNNPYLILSGAEGYAYGASVLNKISSIYHNATYASMTRSITIEDINKVLNISSNLDNYTEIINSDRVIKRFYDKLKLYPEAQFIFGILNSNIVTYGVRVTPGTTYRYNSEDITPDNYLDKKSAINQNGAVNLKGGCIVEVEKDNRNIFWDLLYDKSSDKMDVKSYWLASSGIGTCNTFDRYYEEKDNSALFGLGAVIEEGIIEGGMTLFDSYGSISTYQYGVRPIISLKADITQTQIAKIEGKEQEWEVEVKAGDVESRIIPNTRQTKYGFRKTIVEKKIENAWQQYEDASKKEDELFSDILNEVEKKIKN